MRESSSSSFEATDTLHPVDIVEQIAAANDWDFTREDTDEIAIRVTGHWSDYQVTFNWLEDLEALHIASAFELKVPEARRAEMKELISLVNEQLWIGHFDMWANDGMILLRNSHLLHGGAEVSPEQCQALLFSATGTCDTFYQAFQFVVWAGKTAAESLAAVQFETVGEA